MSDSRWEMDSVHCFYSPSSRFHTMEGRVSVTASAGNHFLEFSHQHGLSATLFRVATLRQKSARAIYSKWNSLSSPDILVSLPSTRPAPPLTTSLLPSGEKASAWIVSVRPEKVRFASPVLGSHRMTS